MELKDLGKEALTITLVLAAIAAIAVLGGTDTGFLRDLAGEWVWWVGLLVAVAVVFGVWARLRQRR
jgi:hypothetical protein